MLETLDIGRTERDVLVPVTRGYAVNDHAGEIDCNSKNPVVVVTQQVS